MKSKFIFSYIDDDKNGIYRDMTSEKARGIIEYLPSHKEMKTSVTRKMERALLSSRVQNSPVCSFFQDLYANLESYHFEPDTNYFILIPSTSIGKLSLKYMEKFHQKHNNVKVFPILTDSMHASSPHMEYVRPKLNSPVWERVLTFDKNDAEEYGFTWFGYSWYSSFEEVNPSDKKSDLFYVGFRKGNREGILADIYDTAIANGVNCDFRVVSSEESIIKPGRSLKYTSKRFAYPDLISVIKSTNCVLEVLQAGQDTQTIKYYEAVCYGKKLLTNNRHLKELPYYSDDKMKYFERVDDIDWNWIKANDFTEYNYKGEFSPLRIVDFLKKLYNV